MSDSRIWTLLAGVMIFFATLAALVALTVTGHSDTNDVVLTLAGPVVAALLITGHTAAENKQQNIRLDQIREQTNGTLDARIRTQTTAALVEAGIIQAPATLTPTVPPDIVLNKSGSSSDDSGSHGVIG